MPNKKSAEKELRKAVKRNAANKKVSNKLKSLVKNNLKQINNSDQAVKQDYPKTIKAIDKAAKKGVIKKNTASRKKSRLMKKINALQ
ncbi:30S ribosomal protein S20 [Candidatus Falkowbacteria bacterium]|jgi:small subunit ribosomal protein S20|nr:30S ribosomal protein S20 [Candidatus Falkowbacteria bacterium]